jgi:hypothetical protein
VECKTGIVALLMLRRLQSWRNSFDSFANLFEPSSQDPYATLGEEGPRIHLLLTSSFHDSIIKLASTPIYSWLGTNPTRASIIHKNVSMTSTAVMVSFHLRLASAHLALTRPQGECW